MSKAPIDQGTLFAPPAEELDEDEEAEAEPVDVAPEGDESPDYDAAAPTEPTPPYRGPWKDSSGMCSASCPAIRQVTGFSRPYTDCQVTGYRVEPGMWPCEIRSVYEAVKRGPEA